MPDTPIDLSRDDLLKAGGASLLAALVALASREADAAEPKKHPHPTPSGDFTATPIGLDFTQPNASNRRAKRQAFTASPPPSTPIKHIQVYTANNVPTFGTQPTVTYSLSTASLAGSVPYNNQDITIPRTSVGTIYISVWT